MLDTSKQEKAVLVPEHSQTNGPIQLVTRQGQTQKWALPAHGLLIAVLLSHIFPGQGRLISSAVTSQPFKRPVDKQSESQSIW